MGMRTSNLLGCKMADPACGGFYASLIPTRHSTPPSSFQSGPPHSDPFYHYAQFDPSGQLPGTSASSPKLDRILRMLEKQHEDIQGIKAEVSCF